MNPEIPPSIPSPEIGPASVQKIDAPLGSPKTPEAPATHEGNIKELEAKLEGGKKELKKNWEKEQAERIKTTEKTDKIEMQKAYEAIEESFNAEGGEDNADEIKDFLNRPVTHANIEELKERLTEGKERLREAQPSPPAEEQETDSTGEREEPAGKPRVETKEDTRDYHEILGVPENASREEILSAYRRRAKETHPDKGGNPEEFRKVQEALENLAQEDKQSGRIYSKPEAPKEQSPFFNEGGMTQEDEESLRKINRAIKEVRAEYRHRTVDAKMDYINTVRAVGEKYDHGKFWRIITFTDKEMLDSYKNEVASAQAIYQEECKNAEERRDRELGRLFEEAKEYKPPRKSTETIHDLWE